MPVVKATSSDVPELNLLVNSAYRGDTSKKGWTTEADLLDGNRIDEDTLSTYFNDPAITILKYTDGDGAIQACVYLEKKQEELYLGMLSVNPELQAGGIGRILLQAAEEHARQIGLLVITITVISTRTELIAWYQRRGYKATGEVLPFHVEEKFGIAKDVINLIVMKKTIN